MMISSSFCRDRRIDASGVPLDDSRFFKTAYSSQARRWRQPDPVGQIHIRYAPVFFQHPKYAPIGGVSYFMALDFDRGQFHAQGLAFLSQLRKH
jgi:hypothetical protein